MYKIGKKGNNVMSGEYIKKPKKVKNVMSGECYVW